MYIQTHHLPSVVNLEVIVMSMAEIRPFPFASTGIKTPLSRNLQIATQGDA